MTYCIIALLLPVCLPSVATTSSTYVIRLPMCAIYLSTRPSVCVPLRGVLLAAQSGNRGHKKF